jgi:hypothetical protein
MKRRRLNENVSNGSVNHSTQTINNYLDFAIRYQGDLGDTDYWKNKGFEEFVSFIDEKLINLCLSSRV